MVAGGGELLQDRIRLGPARGRLLKLPAAIPRRLVQQRHLSLLAHPKTRYAAGMLIRAVGPLLTAAAHAALEEHILAVRACFNEQDERQREYADDARDQLLGCLDPERVQVQAVRDRLAELAAQGGAPRPQEPLRVEGSWTSSKLVDDLASKGISESDVPSALRQALSGLYDDLRVAEGDGDAQLKQAAQGRLLGELQAVVAIVEGDPPGGPLGAMVEELALRAAEVVATDPRVTPDSSVGQLVLSLLLRAADRPARESGGG